jgi:GTP-dependent phosphoenolpyruvate carboxykinase
MQHEALDKLLEVDHDLWVEEVKSIRAYYKTLGDKIPRELYDELDKCELRLNYHKEQEQEVK